MPPTRAEFVARMLAARTARVEISSRRVAISCCWCLPALAWLGVHLVFIKGHFERVWDQLSIVLFLALLFAPGLFILRGFARHHEQRMNELGLRCPACQLEFVNVAGMIAVASGRCGRCGTQVHTGDGPPSS